MRVLVACERSGVVRRAFATLGHDAWSCDLAPAEDGDPQHIQGDILEQLDVTAWNGWDLMIAHPPCTRLAVSGARWFAQYHDEQEEALEFVRWLMDAPVPRIAIENPVSVISTRIRKPDQTVQPWMFGHGETKATCLWLKNLRPLVPTDVVDGRVARVHHESPGPERWKNRSRTYQGLAEAMADQLLSEDVLDAEDTINAQVEKPLNQNQFDALVSFVFNIGRSAFIHSTLLKMINCGLIQESADQFLRWNHINREISVGLTNRRTDERNLFLTEENV